jgi:hypothetical protein
MILLPYFHFSTFANWTGLWMLRMPIKDTVSAKTGGTFGADNWVEESLQTK